MNFLPENYKIPKAPSDYMNFEDGDNTFRIMSSAIVGYEYFTKENKSVRSRVPFEDYPSDIKENGKIKPFWAFIVWNYKLSRIQILELTQKTIMNYIKKALVDNPKWGDPTMYDITVNKTGISLETEYTVAGEPPLAEPTEDIKTAFASKYINLEALFENADPFTH